MDGPIRLEFVPGSSAGDLVFTLWPEDVGAEEDLRAALDELPDVTVDAKPIQLAGPEVVLFAISAASGGTLAGVAAVIRAWAGRHKHHSVTITMPGGSIQVQGQPLTIEQIAQLEKIVADSEPQAESDEG